MKCQRIPFLIWIADVVWIVLAVYLAYECRYGFIVNTASLRDCFSVFWETTIAGVLLWSFVTVVMKPDGFRGGWSLRAVVSDLFVGVFLLMVLLMANGYLARQYKSRLVFFYFGAIALAGFLSVRCLARLVLGFSRFGASVRRVVILGRGQITRELAAKIRQHPEMRRQVAGFLCPESDTAGTMKIGGGGDVQTVRTLDVAAFLAIRKVDEIIVALPNPTRQALDLAAQCQRHGIRVLVLPQAYELYVSRPMLAQVDGLPLIALDQYSLPAGGQAIRWLIDFVVAPFLPLAALPLLIVAVGILTLRKGKAFRQERRCGKGGKVFWMWRLNVDRDVPVLPMYERVLVDLGLTELPQLWNVLLGDMNLVGPRPEAPERVKHYSAWQRQRLKIKPGITGLAQIHGLRDQHSAEQKTHYDLQYILRWSPFLDLSLILQTGWILAARVLTGGAVRKEPLPEYSHWLGEAETPLEEIAYVDHA